MKISMTPAVCRLLFVCFFCTLWGGQVIAQNEGPKEDVVNAASLQEYLTVWQDCVVKNTSDLLSSLGEAEQKINPAEEAVNEIKKAELKAQAKKLVDDIKKEITVAKESATTVKSEADKIQNEMKSAKNGSKSQQEFWELRDEKKMNELKEAAGEAVKLWGPIYKETPSQTKSAGEAASHTTRAKSTAETDPTFQEGEDDDKDKLEKVKNAVSAAKTALGTAATRASEMEGAAKEVEKKLGEMLQTFRNAAGLAARPHEEGAKNEDEQNEKGDTEAGRKNGAGNHTATGKDKTPSEITTTDESTTENEAAESTLRQVGEESSSADRSLLTTFFFPTLLVSFLFGSVTAAIAAA